MSGTTDPWQYDLGPEEPKVMSEYSLLPEGTYVMQVVGMSRFGGGPDNKTPGIDFDLTVIQGPAEKGTSYRARYWTTDKAIQIMKGFLKACGIQYKGVIVLNAPQYNPIGKTLVLRNRHKPGNQDDGKMFNEVAGVMSLDEFKAKKAKKQQAAAPQTEAAPEEVDPDTAPPEDTGQHLGETINLDEDQDQNWN